MKKRTLPQLMGLYRFSIKRESIASEKSDYRSAGLWCLQRLDILDVVLSEYTAEEFFLEELKPCKNH